MRIGSLRASVALALAVATPSAIPAAVVWPPGFDQETVVEGIDKPTAFVYAPDGRLFIAEKAGRVRIVSAAGELLPTPFAIVSVNTSNDRGLIGLALDPDFLANHYVYLSYTTNIVPAIPDNSLSRIHRITRMTASGDVALPASEVVLVDGIPSDTDSHAGGALRFGPDGKLYASIGDGSTYLRVTPLALRALDVDQLVGKILRLNPDGSAPEDNPFYAGPDAIRSKVWQMGLRNPFKATFRPGTGRLLVNDVGWFSWEEVDSGPPGASFGWPCYEGNAPEAGYFAAFPAFCATVPTTAPLYAYGHNSPPGDAITGGAFATGTNYPQAYAGAYFVSDYAQHFIRALTLADDDSVVSVSNFASGDDPFRPVDLAPGPDGDLQYLNIASDFTFPSGSVGRIVYVGSGNHAPRPGAAASPSSGYAPLGVAFSAAGSTDADGDPLTCRWIFGDWTRADGCEAEHQYGTDGSYLATLLVSDGQTEREAKLTITVGSLPPEAVIVEPPPYATYETGETITFSGAAQDPDEGDLPPGSLRWTVILHHNGHEHAYLDAAGAGGAFVAQQGHGVAGDIIAYEVVLTATDASGLSSVSRVVLGENRPPVAGVEADWEAGCFLPGPRLTLDGGRSGDPDDQPITYAWAQTGGPAASLAGADSENPSFAVPIVAGGATMVFRLNVDDGHEIDGASLSVRVPDLSDADGDGDPACSDCAPFDPSLSSPGEVGGLTLGPDGAAIAWDPSAGAQAYELARGTIAPPFSYNHALLAGGLIEPGFRDEASPAPGEAFYYVVWAINLCGPGSLGISSRGSSIPAAAGG